MFTLQLLEISRSAPAPNMGPQLEKMEIDKTKFTRRTLYFNSLWMVADGIGLLYNIELNRLFAIWWIQNEEKGALRM